METQQDIRDHLVIVWVVRCQHGDGAHRATIHPIPLLLHLQVIRDHLVRALAPLIGCHPNQTVGTLHHLSPRLRTMRIPGLRPQILLLPLLLQQQLLL
jgi:hypothetical protein